MANIRDVARLAGVSPTAVSFVINGRYDQLNDETVKRVLKAIKDLDYRPSAVAQSLVTKRSRTIGVLVTQLKHPVETFIVSALVAEARKHGYNTFIWDEVMHAGGDTDVLEMVAEQIASFISQHVEGIIASTEIDDTSLARLRRENIPLVTIDRFTDDCDCINVDFVSGSYMAVSHLASLGRKRLLYLDYGNPLNEQGVRLALNEAGEMRMVYSGRVVRPVEAYRELFRARDTGFDCVYITSDWFALGVYRALEEMGHAIPDDVAVVGFDDTFAGFMTPALTSVSQPLGEMGRQAFRMLLARIEGYDEPPRDIRIQPQLKIRESCGSPARPGKLELIHDVWEKDTEKTTVTVAGPGGRQDGDQHCGDAGSGPRGHKKRTGEKFQHKFWFRAGI